MRRPCAAVATWLAQIRLTDVRQIVGLLRPTVIDELLTKIAAAVPPPAARSAADAAPAGASTEPSAAADEPPAL